ncbi:MAG: DUF2207 domain-containing protein [Thermodesulfovibrionales bacterium]|nr:DUF2207 domain-containing protein [Thermodesulfovibrionales bacterium]
MLPNTRLLFRSIRFLFIGIVFFLSLYPHRVSAEERILSFHSDITVHQDAFVTIQEAITVQSEGEKIKRGIYRDFPTRYRDNLGNRYTVGFTVVKVLRDGNPEPFHIQDVSNGKRVYIGDENVFIPHGEHTYTILYKTNRQVGFFHDHDELYWNVTGNGWEFPIEEASASLRLPGNAGAHITDMDGYTGPQGSKGKDFTMFLDPEGVTHFSSSKVLGPLEGLTISVSWEKGFIAEPDALTKAGYFVSDNTVLLLVIFGLAVIVIYYLMVWSRFGRDPASGVIVTRYSPPDTMSPAVMGFITRMGYDDTVFTSAIIHMAVKGRIKIIEDDGEYTLQKQEGNNASLTPEEATIFQALLSASDEITLKNANHQKIRAAIDGLKKSLALKYEKFYFITNFRYFLIGLLLTVILLFLSGSGEAMSKGTLPVFLFICVWLSIWSLGVIALASAVVKSWKGMARSRGGKKILKTWGALSINLFALPFFAGELFGLGILWYATSFSTIIVMIMLIGINYLFYHLLKAPTRAGRILLDAIEGFKVFLVATEKDRLNMLNPPERTPALFEKYLPYALALNVEQLWAEQFSDVLSTAAGEGGVAYGPAWYSGSALSSMAMGDFASSLSGTFSSAISASSSAPGSSSGSGGGGSSGGGGGGGGGGGW